MATCWIRLISEAKVALQAKVALIDEAHQTGAGAVEVRLTLSAYDRDDALFERCDLISVDSVRMLVMQPTDLLLSRLLALGENSCNFAPLLGWSRSLREQIDWPTIRHDTADNPFARAFLGLLEDLEVIDANR